MEIRVTIEAYGRNPKNGQRSMFRFGHNELSKRTVLHILKAIPKSKDRYGSLADLIEFVEQGE